MLTERENFRYGFLLACAQDGLTLDGIRERVKQAAERVKQGAIPLGWYFTAPATAAAYGILASAGLGALGGHVGANLTEQELDPAEVKRQELLALYRQQAERARRSVSRVRYRRPAEKPTGPKLF